MRQSDARLSIADKLHIDQVCLSFEAAWKAGEARPQLDTYVAKAAEPERSELLRQLLLLDLDYRGRRGEAADRQEYERLFPQDSSVIEQALRASGTGTSADCAAPQPSGGPDLTSSLRAPEESSGPAADSIPGYSIVREIHRGGQGVVYQALQKTTRRKVAIKVMREGPFAGKHDRARFEREAQVLAALKHPNIVAIHESGSAAGSFYFVMDYISGQPLDVYMAGGRRSVRDTLLLFQKICEAVNAAHLRGVIHRDLKPGNIRVDADGQPQILDFGLAKVAPGQIGGESVSMTQTGQFVGSLPWASPEQAEGIPSRIDIRTDVYSLGVILYQMLTGKFPYEVAGGFREVLDRIMTAPPIRPRTLRMDIDDEVETIVLKCLHKERERRYQSAGELARDIGHYLAGAPIEAKRDSTLYVLRMSLRRYRLPVVIAAGFVLMLTAGLIVSLNLWHRSARERDRALSAENVALSEKTRAEEALYRASIVAAQQSMESGRYDSARRFLSEAPADHRGFEWGCLQYFCNLDRFTLHGHSDPVNALSCSPDGRSLASASSDRTVRIWDLHTGALVSVLTGHEDVLYAVAYSPDGRFLATGSRAPESSLRIWDVRTGREVARVNAGASSIMSVAYSPDGTLIAAGTTDGRARVWDASTRELRFTRDAHVGQVRSVAFSPDGARLATASYMGDNVIKLWDARSGAFLFSPGGHGAGVPSICFSPDGSLLASAGRDGFCKVWNPATQKEVRTFDVGSIFLWSVAFSPDGAYLAIGGRDCTIRVFRTASGEEIRRFKGHGGGVNAVGFSRDGKTIISAGEEGVVKLWPWPQAIEATELIGHDSDVMSVVFDPRGERVATGSYDGTARLWDRLTGRELRTLDGAFERVRGVAFSPTGDRLALACSDGTARVWDSDGVAEQCLIAGHSAEVNSVAFYPDGATLLTSSSDRTAKAWDLASGRMRACFQGHKAPVRCGAVSPDGNWVATAGDDSSARIWSASTGTLAHILAGRFRLDWAAFSPDSRRVATSSADGTARIWDVASGTLILVLKGHTSEIQQIEFSPDGQRLATVSIDASAKIWDACTGRELMTLRPRTNPGRMLLCLHCLAFSPDGTCLATGGGSADPVSVYLWPTLLRTRDDSAAASGGDVMEAIKRQHWESVLQARSTPRPLPERGKPTTAPAGLRLIKATTKPVVAADSAEQVSTLVRALPMDPSEIGPDPLLLLRSGEYALLGNDAVRAVELITEAVETGGTQGYYFKSLGWALLMAGEHQQANLAFNKSLPGSWSPALQATADPDHWTAAYFLGLVTREQYAERWRNDAKFKEKFACFPWFYIGQRMEIEGKRDEAIAAYRRSVELGGLPDAHYIRHWSAYRLHILTGEPLDGAVGAPASQPDSRGSTLPGK